MNKNRCNEYKLQRFLLFVIELYSILSDFTFMFFKNMNKPPCFQRGSACRKSHFKSLGQAFSKACRFLGQRPKPTSAEVRIPQYKALFCRGVGRFFQEKKRPTGEKFSQHNPRKSCRWQVFRHTDRCNEYKLQRFLLFVIELYSILSDFTFIFFKNMNKPPCFQRGFVLFSVCRSVR